MQPEVKEEETRGIQTEEGFILGNVNWILGSPNNGFLTLSLLPSINYMLLNLLPLWQTWLENLGHGNGSSTLKYTITGFVSSSSSSLSLVFLLIQSQH